MNQMQNIPKPDFSEEELAVIKAQGKKLGDDHIRAIEAEWPELIKKVQAMIKNGVSPKDKKVTPLAKRWMELVKQFTGGYKGVEAKVSATYKQTAHQITMGDPKGPNMAECVQYIQQALK